MNSHLARKQLPCIDSAQGQPVSKSLVKTIIAAMSVLIAKLKNIPDVSTVIQAILSIRSDLKTTGETV
ncbi:hypothetical protein BGZ57DRAFT_909459 [Hyaloscypha finlandica]|nr:hypothetical protein BGZ57DRAFT_909459 [Hyaloscypha finlandica]KAH8760846.1 hypothetical protein F5882DRAFT_416428 [Hyaloscypha sp. PMI_1271]